MKPLEGKPMKALSREQAQLIDASCRSQLPPRHPQDIPLNDSDGKMKFVVSIVGALVLVAQAGAQAVRAHIVSCSG